jgi:activating signal cointegrator 1
MIPKKAITLYQPHATAVALGWKKNETRGQRWHWRGMVAIHAARERHRSGEEIRRQALDLLAQANVVEIPELMLPSAGFPRGAIVAIARMVDCVRTEDVRDLSPLERAFGDYKPGRFAWKLADVRAIEPIECKGAQGIWEIPPAIRRAIERQVAA